jgi:hypothetical protein
MSWSSILTVATDGGGGGGEKWKQIWNLRLLLEFIFWSNGLWHCCSLLCGYCFGGTSCPNSYIRQRQYIPWNICIHLPDYMCYNPDLRVHMNNCEYSDNWSFKDWVEPTPEKSHSLLYLPMYKTRTLLICHLENWGLLYNHGQSCMHSVNRANVFVSPQPGEQRKLHGCYHKYACYFMLLISGQIIET